MRVGSVEDNLAVVCLAETFFAPPLRPLAESRSACLRVLSEVVPLLGGGSFTPARRALESPIAIACFVDRAPCFSLANMVHLFAHKLSSLGARQ